MKKRAIILFVRNPELGKVKTRLAATVGEKYALEIYKKLLDHTLMITKDLSCDKHVFYADQINRKDIWNPEIYQKKMQEGLNLGERMACAFDLLFATGYTEVLIIGSDCYDLSQDDIENAFDLLQEVDVVLGPASDGGYYLLGLKEPSPELFSEIAWSNSSVLNETKNRLEKLKKSYLLLSEKSDVDEEKDLPVSLRLAAAIDGVAYDK